MKESYEFLSIPKSTGTYGDIFAAVGLANVLSVIPDANPVAIEERDAEFQVIPSRPILMSDLERVPHLPGYAYLRPNEKAPVPASIADYVDYPREAERVNRYWKQRDVLRKKGTQDIEIINLLKDDLPREDWELWRALNNLQGDETTNRIYLEIISDTPQQFKAALHNGVSAIANKGSSELKWNITQSMLFSPSSAKGYRELKPADTKRKNYKIDTWADPFVEWLKYQGYFQCALPRLMGKDVRIIVPVPSRITLIALQRTVRELRSGVIYGGPPKMDALAVLKTAEILVLHSEEYHHAEVDIFPGLSLSGKSPANIISGMMVTHYQSLGNAKAVMQMSMLALPGWFPIHNAKDAELWLVLLDEHQRIVRSLKEDRSDEIGLLLAYRRFLQKRGESSIWALVEFMERYGMLVMRVNGLKDENRVRWMTRFTTEYFRRIVMAGEIKFSEIIRDPGFEAVAAAVRNATVAAQNKKARKEDVWRDIRYELLHDIHRTRQVPGNAFTECICEFISRYNYENARHREIKRDLRAAPPNISDEQLQSFIKLIDTYKAPIVGALLAAYGTCKEKWGPEENGQSVKQQNESSKE